jgi:hypothetical protein
MEYTVHVGVENHRLSDLMDAVDGQFRQSLVVEGDHWDYWGEPPEAGLPSVLHAQFAGLTLSSALYVTTALIGTERMIMPAFPRLLRPMTASPDSRGVLVVISNADNVGIQLYSFVLDMRNLPSENTPSEADLAV